MFFPPLVFVFIVVFFFILLFLFGLVHVGVISYAFQKVGIGPEHMFSLLFFSLLGSYVNIPIKKMPCEPLMIERTVVSYFGFRFRIPAYVRKCESVLAVNLGGAIIPLLISLYLLFKTGVFFGVLMATAVVALIVHKLSRLVPGMGITVPALIPPVVAAIAAIVLAPSNSPPVAYISGTMGTLIGADILNIGKIRRLNAPVASIGGAGTFDGIFFTGIMAVLLA